MNDRITLYGKIIFEVENKTKKHELQSSWKRMAMVMLGSEVTEYYAWFIQKRYNLILNKPLRGGHISFINDSIDDMIRNNNHSPEEAQTTWDAVKEKYDKTKVKIVLDLRPRTNDKHWWLNIPHDERHELQGIRNELGLGTPNWGLHMSIGYANDKNIEHSKYIHRLIKNGIIT